MYRNLLKFHICRATSIAGSANKEPYFYSELFAAKISFCSFRKNFFSPKLQFSQNFHLFLLFCLHK